VTFLKLRLLCTEQALAIGHLDLLPNASAAHRRPWDAVVSALAGQIATIDHLATSQIRRCRCQSFTRHSSNPRGIDSLAPLGRGRWL
jgi:hypothetical protein